VAAFAGLADFVPAQVRNGRVETELGNFAFDGPAPAREVDLLLRPDDVDLQPDPAGQGRIVAREFKGADNLYSVRLPSGRTVRSVQPSEAIYQIGQRVLLRAHLDHVLLFAREAEGVA
jgi:iron(III) transport system ATP-binding protein